MWSRIKDQPAVGKLIARYDQLPTRDCQALTALGIALLLALIYLLIWQPVTQFHDRAASNRENAAELLAWMQANETTIQRLGTTGGAATTAAGADKPEDGRALMALVTRSAGEAGLSLQRFEPSGEDAIRVWLENAAYADVAAWLERLHSNHGVVIDQAALDRGNGPGQVSVRLTLAI
ncbi:type II secretion system protein GspM [Marinobacter nauticus]|uniref:type II secretion system protein GspM n=1 Tax=Marinobacter nauticus TaxID=2743 RepID=UPI001C99B8EF|nr:type II secretion system protein M [Marinobacter nauticus]MBY5935921.1 type II secretion system protein M [Marinobacter nauticus]MBY5953150.1 type II secretion system protein M [Marinobacter nauticus]MBY6006943.1 type II secretion system protein M [Marinobacter nauticus]